MTSVQCTYQNAFNRDIFGYLTGAGCWEEWLEAIEGYAKWLSGELGLPDNRSLVYM